MRNDTAVRKKGGGGGGNSLAVQGLGLPGPTAGGRGSIPGWGAKIPQAMQYGKKKKRKKEKNDTAVAISTEHPYLAF